MCACMCVCVSVSVAGSFVKLNLWCSTEKQKQPFTCIHCDTRYPLSPHHTHKTSAVSSYSYLCFTVKSNTLCWVLTNGHTHIHPNLPQTCKSGDVSIRACHLISLYPVITEDVIFNKRIEMVRSAGRQEFKKGNKKESVQLKVKELKKEKQH